MVYEEMRMDIFLVPEDFHFAQCISADCKMGKGIAVEFNNHFDVKKHLEDQKAFLMSEWDRGIKGNCVRDGRVFNLITKMNYWHKPTYSTMEAALLTLRNMTRAFSIKKLAMPRIGCGLDQLEWGEVSEIILDVFKDDDIHILICYI